MTQQNPIKVALIDDDLLFVKGLASLIRSNSISISFEAPNGKEALEMLSNAAELPDLCILDLNMPEMNGYETLIEIKRRWNDMKVLILSRFHGEYNMVRTIRSGANGFLSKSTHPDILISTVNSIVKMGYDFSGTVQSKVYSMIQKDADELPSITKRELEFLKLCCSDMNYKEIAAAMHVTARSADSYRDSLCNKLDVCSRAGLIMFALQMGIIPPGN